MSTDEVDEFRSRTSKRAKPNVMSTYLQYFEAETVNNATGLQYSEESQPIESSYQQQQRNDVIYEDAVNHNILPNNNEPTSIISDLTFVNSTDISKILELLIEIKSDVSNIQQQLAEVRVKQDHLETLVSNKPVVTNQSSELFKLDRGNIFPLDTIENLNAFEERLSSDKLYKNDVMEHWKCVIGTSCKWKVAAYQLSGFLFTTNLLANYSWTGVSRLTEAKESFQKLVEVLHLFYIVIQNADSSFIIADGDNFFKNKVLKYGQSRLRGCKCTTEKKKQTNEELGEGEKQEENGRKEQEESSTEK